MSVKPLQKHGQKSTDEFLKHSRKGCEFLVVCTAAMALKTTKTSSCRTHGLNDDLKCMAAV
eukprot:2893726-Amphidinium_carterae.1